MEKILKPNKSDIKNDIGNINKKGNEDNISNKFTKEIKTNINPPHYRRLLKKLPRHG